MRRSPAAGFTIVELLIVLALIGIISSLAVIGTRAARVRSAETAAIAALHAINKAQFAFMQTCGNQSYAPTLASLGVPPPGSDSAFLSPDLTQSDPLQKSGYIFYLTGTVDTEATAACTGAMPLSGYSLTADPASEDPGGMRWFGTNTDRVIFADATTYTGNMPESGSPGHGAEVRP